MLISNRTICFSNSIQNTQNEASPIIHKTWHFKEFEGADFKDDNNCF